MARKTMNPIIKQLMLEAGYAAPDIATRATKLAYLVAEYCAGICEEMGTATAGCDGGKPTKIADDCADWIRKDFGIKS